MSLRPNPHFVPLLVASLLGLGLTLVGPKAAAAAATNQTATATNRVDTVDAEPAAAPTEPTVVTSEHLNVDYLHNLGTFTGNVLVVDPRITVRSDKMVVYYDMTNQTQGATNQTTRTLSKIEASGGVIITAGDKKAESEHAVYTAVDGKVVLTINPHVEGPDGTVTGERITFWRDDKRMDVESGTRLILYPQQDKKKTDNPGEAVPKPKNPPTP